MVDPVKLIGGVYSLTRNENFCEYLIAQGIEDDKANEIDRLKPLLRISLEGKDVTITTEMESCLTTSTLRLNEEVEERIALNMNIKSHTTIEDNKLKICSEGPNGEVGTRIFEFSESEMIMTLSSDDSNVPQAKRFYKRM